jgi:hypothetical protein
MSRDSLRLGMSGSATAFAGNAGVIGLLASILVWVSSYTAYGVSLAGRTQNGQDARKKRTSLSDAARFR